MRLVALNIWSCTTLRGQFTPCERTSPLQTLNATPFIRLWNLPYQITHRIFAPLLLLGGLFVFSFPIFSPAETQVSIYLLGTAGCKSFTGLLFAFTLRLGTLTWAKPGITRETTEPNYLEVKLKYETTSKVSNGSTLSRPSRPPLCRIPYSYLYCF